MEKFLKYNNIKQLYLSSSLNINNTILKDVNMSTYSSNKENTLFFGMYNKNDYEMVESHKGKKWILWGGNDADISNKERVKLMKNMKDVEKHIACKDKIFINLIEIFGFSKVCNINKLDNYDINFLKDSSNDYKFIFYDPKYKNNFGHYDIFLLNLREVYGDNIIHLTNLDKDLKRDDNYIFYCYIYDNSIFELKLKNYILKNLKKDTLLVFNLWFKEDIDKILDLKEEYKDYNVYITTDGNIKKLDTNLYINDISPPLINYKNKEMINYNKTKDDYYLTFTWNQNKSSCIRWLSFDYFIELSNKLDKKLKIIYNDPNIKNLKEYPNIRNLNRNSIDDNIFLNLCKNAKCVLILQNPSYYNFRSSKKIIDLLYNDIPFVCNFNHFHFNNINYYIDNNNFTIDNLRSKIFNQRKINVENYYNINFKKIISVLNISNLLSNKKIDILGNGPDLKNYKWNNNNIKMGFNVAYRYWIKNNVYPDIYVSLDPVVTEYHAENIFDLIKLKKIKYFFLNSIFFEKYKETLYLENVFNFELLKQLKFINSSPHITTGIFGVRLSIIMGFKDISVYGMNGNYINYLPECKIVEQNVNGIKVLKIIKDVNNNPNYFFNYYQQKGDLYQIPNANNEYTCKCSFHNNTIVKQSLHKYVFDVLQFDLKKFNFKYKFTQNEYIKNIFLYS